MKADRRHELQHNEIADWVAEAVERVKPYSRAITGVLVAAAVLLTAYVVLSSRAERRQSTAWTDYYTAIQAPQDSIDSELESVARDHEDVPAGRWAEVALADLKLGEGISSFFKDKTLAEKRIKTAIKHYESAIPKADDPLLAARARFGLARAYESLGQLQEARELYQEVVNASGTNAYVSVAKSRLEDLKRDSTQDFYAWFAKQEPVPVPDAPLPGTPGEKMPFDSGFTTPGSLDSLGKSPFSVPELDKGATGPLLTPETPAKDKKEPDNKAADKTAADGGKDAKSDEREAAKEQPPSTPAEGSSKEQRTAKEETSPPKSNEGSAADGDSKGKNEVKETTDATSKQQKDEPTDHTKGEPKQETKAEAKN